MMRLLFGLLLLLVPAFAFGQGAGGGGVSSGPALTTQRGATLPAACAIGQLFFKTDALAGQNIYECASANTWTQQLNDGTSAAAGSSGQIQFNNGSNQFAGSAGLAYNDTTKALGVYGPIYSGSNGSFAGALTLYGATTGAGYWTVSATGGLVGLSNSAGFVPTHQLHISTSTNNSFGIDSTGTDSNAMFHIKNVGVQGPFFDFWAASDRYAWGVSSGGTFVLRHSAVDTDPVNGTDIVTVSSTGGVTAAAGFSTGANAGIADCTAVTAGATITIKGGLITAMTGC